MSCFQHAVPAPPRFHQPQRVVLHDSQCPSSLGNLPHMTKFRHKGPKSLNWKSAKTTHTLLATQTCFRWNKHINRKHFLGSVHGLFKHTKHLATFFSHTMLITFDENRIVNIRRTNRTFGPIIYKLILAGYICKTFALQTDLAQTYQDAYAFRPNLSNGPFFK